MAPIRFTVFTVLIVLGSVSAGVFDTFGPYSRDCDSEKFDFVKPGKCQETGCTRPPSRGGPSPRVCRGPLRGIGGATVCDRKGSNCDGEKVFKKGVKECARECRDMGESADGGFVCDSFNYRADKDGSQCLFYKGFPNKLLGSTGRTRVDFTEYYCYTRETRRFIRNSCFNDCNQLQENNADEVREDQCQ